MPFFNRTRGRRSPALRAFSGWCLLVACGSVAVSAGASAPALPVRREAAGSFGLSAGPGGTVLRDGKPWRGIGVNYFDCFLRTLANGDDSSYEAGLAELARCGIPFARFCATGFWPKDLELYQNNKGEYFRRLDGVVCAAERQGVGLVPSLFWSFPCVPDLVGEPAGSWGDRGSRTHAWMRNYVREVVGRYRRSPAVWFWEFGNEYNLIVDLPSGPAHWPKVVPARGTPGVRTGGDELRLAQYREAAAAFGEAVRELDPGRLIVTGAAMPRPAAWHLAHERSWRKDDERQFTQILDEQNPAPVDALSVHIYAEEDLQRLSWLTRASAKLAHPVFVGEFGVKVDERPEPVRRAAFEAMLHAVVDAGVPIAALWVYDFPKQNEWNITATNERAWQLDAIAATNRGR